MTEQSEGAKHIPADALFLRSVEQVRGHYFAVPTGPVVRRKLASLSKWAPVSVLLAMLPLLAVVRLLPVEVVNSVFAGLILVGLVSFFIVESRARRQEQQKLPDRGPDVPLHALPTHMVSSLRGYLTSIDRGWVWIENGAVCFTGGHCSFRLRLSHLEDVKALLSLGEQCSLDSPVGRVEFNFYPWSVDEKGTDWQTALKRQIETSSRQFGPVVDVYPPLLPEPGLEFPNGTLGVFRSMGLALAALTAYLTLATWIVGASPVFALAIVGAFSLLVGGIGILLISLTERLRSKIVRETRQGSTLAAPVP